jgi:chitinase
MPAPADVQATNRGATIGRFEPGDELVLAFAGTVNPDLVISGWDGSATAITPRLSHVGSNDVFTFERSGTTILPLGLLNLQANYANAMTFAAAMTLSNDTITIVLGASSGGTLHTVGLPNTMTWSTPTGSASESGLSDIDF